MAKDEIWGRLPDESAKAYEAFCAYRDLGPSRSIPKAGEIVGKGKGTLEPWSSKYNWPERAAAWDAEQDRIARKAQLDEIIKMRKRHAEIAKRALEKVSEALDNIETDRMNNSDIARLMEVSSKLERLSRGDVGDVIEERDGGEAINPVQIYVPDNGRGNQDTFDDLNV